MGYADLQKMYRWLNWRSMQYRNYKPLFTKWFDQSARYRAWNREVLSRNSLMNFVSLNELHRSIASAFLFYVYQFRESKLEYQWTIFLYDWLFFLSCLVISKFANECFMFVVFPQLIRQKLCRLKFSLYSVKKWVYWMVNIEKIQ